MTMCSLCMIIETYILFEKYLNKINDLDRILQKIIFRFLLQPTEIFNLDYSYLQI